MAVDSFQPITGLESMAGVHNRLYIFDGNHTHLSVDAEKIDSVLKHLTHFGVQSIISTPPTLEELFLRYYGEGYSLDEEYTGK